MSQLLYDKIHGCIAACTVGNALGDPVEGMEYYEVEEKYGFVDGFIEQTYEERHTPQEYEGLGPIFHNYPHVRAAGMTEDGMERHKICARTVIEKGGRINIYDLGMGWVKYIDPKNFGYLLGCQDKVIYNSLKAGVPPWEVGKHASWPGFIGTTKMITPIGIVNACNPELAAQDAFELGRIKDTRGIKGNYALEVCAGYAAGIAEALKPDATLDGVIKVVLSYLSRVPLEEVNELIEVARNAKSWKDARPYTAEKYKNAPISNAVEILGGGLSCLIMANGDTKNTILYASNFGRDTDCKAFLAGGLAGALNGYSSVPEEWIKQVDSVTKTNPYTVSNLLIKEETDGLYAAMMNTYEKMKNTIDSIEKRL